MIYRTCSPENPCQCICSLITAVNAQVPSAEARDLLQEVSQGHGDHEHPGTIVGDRLVYNQPIEAKGNTPIPPSPLSTAPTPLPFSLAYTPRAIYSYKSAMCKNWLQGKSMAESKLLKLLWPCKCGDHADITTLLALPRNFLALSHGICI